MTDLETMLRDPILSQKAILAAREFIEKWEGWIEQKRPALSETEVDLHEMSVRYAKGVIKIWRIWLTRQPRPVDKVDNTNGALS